MMNFNLVLFFWMSLYLNFNQNQVSQEKKYVHQKAIDLSEKDEENSVGVGKVGWPSCRIVNHIHSWYRIQPVVLNVKPAAETLEIHLLKSTCQYFAIFTSSYLDDLPET